MWHHPCLPARRGTQLARHLAALKSSKVRREARQLAMASAREKMDAGEDSTHGPLAKSPKDSEGLGKSLPLEMLLD